MRSYTLYTKHDLCSTMTQLFIDIVWLSSRHGLIIEKDLTVDLLDLDNPVKWLNRSEPSGQFYILNSLIIVVQEEPMYYI